MTIFRMLLSEIWNSMMYGIFLFFLNYPNKSIYLFTKKTHRYLQKKKLSRDVFVWLSTCFFFFFPVQHWFFPPSILSNKNSLWLISCLINMHPIVIFSFLKTRASNMTYLLYNTKGLYISSRWYITVKIIPTIPLYVFHST
jgi:hypothetical protein